MRIISGDARGRRLAAPHGLKTRPATARVRASIFSRLASRLDFTEVAVLDLFAGSGSLGIEALSRGALHATFVDASRVAITTIARNLEQLGFAGRARVLSMSVTRALASLNAEGQQFALVFVDPPFAADSSADLLAKLASLELLKPDGIVVVRRFHRAPDIAVAEFERISIATVGDHRIALYRRPPPQ